MSSDSSWTCDCDQAAPGSLGMGGQEMQGQQQQPKDLGLEQLEQLHAILESLDIPSLQEPAAPADGLGACCQLLDALAVLESPPDAVLPRAQPHTAPQQTGPTAGATSMATDSGLAALPSAIRGMLGVAQHPVCYQPSFRFPPYVQAEGLAPSAGAETSPMPSIALATHSQSPDSSFQAGRSVGSSGPSAAQQPSECCGAAGTAPSSAQLAPRRRGLRRQGQQGPVDEQAAARRSAQLQAQLRYLQRRREKMKEMELQIEELAVQLEAARLAQESARCKAHTLELVVGYKEEMVEVLEMARQLGCGQPGTQLSPGTLAYLQEYDAGGTLSPDVVFRYAPAGHRENQDEQGLPRSAPPFEWIVEDYSDAVRRFQEILAAAEAAGKVAEDAGAGALPLRTPPAPHPLVHYLELPEMPPWRHFAGPQGGAVGARPALRTAALLPLGQQGGSDDTAGMQVKLEAQEGSIGPGSWRGGQLLERGDAGGGSSSSGADGGGRDEASSSSGGDGGGRGAASRSSGGGGSGTSSGDSGGDGPIITGGGAGGASESSEGGESNGNDEAMQSFLQESCLHTCGQHAAYQGGLLVLSGDSLLHFERGHLTEVAELITRVGALMWQQAVLFPENMMRAFAARMDTGAICESQEAGHWERVVEQLRLQPQQLRLIVGLQEEYHASVGAVDAKRRGATQRLLQLQSQLDGCSPINLAQEASRLSLETRECAALLEQCVHEEHAAEVKLTIGIIRMLEFPRQFAQLFALSWPFFPKAAAISSISARLVEEGLSDSPASST